MTSLVGRQHFLPSLSWLAQQLVISEAFTNIALMPKGYSTVNHVIAEILRRNIRVPLSVEDCFRGLTSGTGLVLLDEGGALHDYLPRALRPSAASVEQTTFGLRTAWNCPTVLVCRSAAKLHFESQIIARGILRKLDSIGLLTERPVGILGLGALGAEIARALLAKGIPVLGADLFFAANDLNQIRSTQSEILHRCKLILGCTGRDPLSAEELVSISGTKIFVSCSSSNIEFRSVISALPPIEAYSNVEGWIGDMNCIVMNGGYPINFDREHEWERLDEIMLTRRLVHEGVLQAKKLIGSPARGVMLDPVVQCRVVSEWLETVSDRDGIRVPSNLTEEFFLQNSEGEYQ